MAGGRSSSFPPCADHQTTKDLEPEQMSRFRMLRLHGGGAKGTFTAAVLSELESISKKQIYRYFDLITGTSTGGIIAIALGLGVPASEILEFYVSEGPKIFPAIGVQKSW